VQWLKTQFRHLIRPRLGRCPYGRTLERRWPRKSDLSRRRLLGAGLKMGGTAVVASLTGFGRAVLAAVEPDTQENGRRSSTTVSKQTISIATTSTLLKTAPPGTAIVSVAGSVEAQWRVRQFFDKEGNRTEVTGDAHLRWDLYVSDSTNTWTFKGPTTHSFTPTGVPGSFGFTVPLELTDTVAPIRTVAHVLGNVDEDGRAEDEIRFFGFAQEPPGPNTISGTVLNRDTSEGVPGATVTLSDRKGNVLGVTVTDENGSFSFSDLPDGTYVLDAAPPAGFRSAGAQGGVGGVVIGGSILVRTRPDVTTYDDQTFFVEPVGESDD
jgi:hypothetical protein